MIGQQRALRRALPLAQATSGQARHAVGHLPEDETAAHWHTMHRAACKSCQEKPRHQAAGPGDGATERCDHAKVMPLPAPATREFCAPQPRLTLIQIIFGSIGSPNSLQPRCEARSPAILTAA